MKVNTSHRHSAPPPEVKGPSLKKQIQVALEPYVHPHRYQNKQLLKTIGILEPSRALVANNTIYHK